MKWSGIPISQNFPLLAVIHTVRGFIVVNEAEVDILLEFPWFLCDPVDVGYLRPGSSAFSKASLFLWTFLDHVLWKHSLKDFEHYPASL